MFRFRSPLKTELVIAMTLAEMFLLLLFVVWYGEVEAKDGQPDWQTVAEKYRIRVKELEKDLEAKNAELATWKSVVEWWKDNFNSAPPRSSEELQAALRSPAGRSLLADLARGYPRCEAKNVLVRAAVQNGAITVRMVGESERLSEWAGKAGASIPAMGSELRDAAGISNLLQAIRDFYRDQPKACRFDYQLTYRTKPDYADGRMMFETIFYAGGILRQTD